MPDPGPFEPLLDRFARHLRVVRNLAPSTVSNSRHYVACFLDWWRRSHTGGDLSEVKTRHLHDFLIAESERGLAPPTVAAEVSSLRAFFRWLVAEDALPTDPSATLRSPRSNRKRVEVYSPAEADAILRARGSRRPPARGGRQGFTAPGPGRASTPGRGARGFATEVRAQLPDTPFLFVNTHPFVPDPLKRCSVSNLQWECRLAATGAGVRGRHYPHRWRHSFATELIRAGVSVAHVQRQLGHASIVSTMIYTHLHVDDVQESLDQVFDR